ncbi:MAG TPA: hypothetical protein VG269_07460 [Tepidisphaeraceae bacterium]|jgi:hypothetical protein|nr:hypothetical protein [Tepidisphaeraceae bacterium]
MYELLKEKTVSIPVISLLDQETVAEVYVDEDHKDLAKLRWYQDCFPRDDEDEYTVVDVLGTEVHVRMDDILTARHLGVAVVTGGVRPGGQCPNVHHSKPHTHH